MEKINRMKNYLQKNTTWLSLCQDIEKKLSNPYFFKKILENFKLLLVSNEEKNAFCHKLFSHYKYTFIKVDEYLNA